MWGAVGTEKHDHRREPGRRLQEQGVIAEDIKELWGPKWADTDICAGYVSSPSLMLLQKNIETKFLLSWRRLKRSSRPVISASPGNTLEMQILRPHTRPAESDSLQVEPATPGFRKLSRGFLCLQKFHNHGLTSPTSLFYRQNSDAQGPATRTWWSEQNRIPAFRILVQNLKYFIQGLVLISQKYQFPRDLNLIKYI